MSRQLRCSFCRKSEDQVSKLVAGPNVYICDACVKIATDIMEHSGPGAPTAPRKIGAGLRRLWNRFFGTGTDRHSGRYAPDCA
jgi:hypothetical protein